MALAERQVGLDLGIGDTAPPEDELPEADGDGIDELPGDEF
jgi:hypothetical protein